MKIVLSLLLVVAVAHCALAKCSNVKNYSTTFVPACDPDDFQLKWPNYADATTYYACVAQNSPTLVSCPTGQYFAYVYQKCVSCSQYLAPVKCENLKTQNPPICN